MATDVDDVRVEDERLDVGAERFSDFGKQFQNQETTIHPFQCE